MPPDQYTIYYTINVLYIYYTIDNAGAKETC